MGRSRHNEAKRVLVEGAGESLNHKEEGVCMPAHFPVVGRTTTSSMGGSW